MQAAKKARMKVTGDLLHQLLELPETVEVLDTVLELRGEGLPDDCEHVEGAVPPFVNLLYRDGKLVPTV